MQCAHCNWQNPNSYKDCFSCGKPLVPAPDATGSGQFAAREPVAEPIQRRPAKPTEPQAHFGAAEPDSLLRAFATLVDALLMSIGIAVLLAGSFYLLRTQGGRGSDSPIAWTLAVLGSILLPFAFTGLLNSLGGSLGKRLFGLRVVTTSGDNPSLLRSTLREVLKYASNLSLPFLFHTFDRVVFGSQFAHNVITDVYVVRRKSGPNNLRRYIDSQAGRRKKIRVFAITAVCALVAAVGGLIGFFLVKEAIYDARNPAAAASRNALSEIVQAGKPVTDLAASHYARTGAFAPSIDALGIGKMPSGISALQVDKRNGAITATIDSQAAEGRINGKHLTWVPQFKTGKKATELRRWQCGSPDIAKEELPFLCDADTKVLQSQ